MLARTLAAMAVACFLLAPSGATGNALVDGNKLAEYCEIKDEAVFSFGFCLGFVAAVADMDSPVVCYPSPIKLGQMKKVVAKYLEDNPEKLHLPAVNIIILALKDAFPCPKKD